MWQLPDGQYGDTVTFTLIGDFEGGGHRYVGEVTGVSHDVIRSSGGDFADNVTLRSSGSTGFLSTCEFFFPFPNGVGVGEFGVDVLTIWTSPAVLTCSTSLEHTSARVMTITIQDPVVVKERAVSAGTFIPQTGAGAFTEAS